MMQPIIVATWAFWAFRLLWATWIGSTGTSGAIVWMISEYVQGYFGFMNLLRATSWDSSWWGWSMVIGYGISYAFVPTFQEGPDAVFMAYLLLGLLAVRTVATISLGRSYSSGAPNLLVIVTRYPYSAVRHPLSALAVLQRIVFLLASPSLWNLCVVTWGAFMAWLCAHTEEKFLASVSAEYRDYMRRVPHRFLPLGGAR